MVTLVLHVASFLHTILAHQLVEVCGLALFQKRLIIFSTMRVVVALGGESFVGDRISNEVPQVQVLTS